MTNFKTKKAFTLIELTVVITIVVLLSTILFDSLVSYNKTTRDTIRISDISTIQSALELYYLGSVFYPEPSNSFPVSYSGTKVWDQGYFTVETIGDVTKLAKEPVDPLNSRKYTYSLTDNSKQYQIAGIQESLENGFKSGLFTAAFAGDKNALAYVIGNYNQKAYKVISESDCTIISLPSIISSDLNTEFDVKNIIDNKTLVYYGFKNIPTNFTGSTFEVNGGFDFVSGKEIVYSDTNKCRDLYDEFDNTARKTLIQNMQVAYSGSLIKDNTKIAGMLAVEVNNDTYLDNYSIDFVKKRLSGK